MRRGAMFRQTYRRGPRGARRRRSMRPSRMARRRPV
ncbi:hypothetical protein BURMUCF1_3148, partial [Burkholderia multivorans ATCC BAA-247]